MARLMMRKVKRKCGRKFIKNVVREPNGRISRAIKIQEPADRLALSVRARHLGVSMEEARDPRLSTYVGRLYRLGVQAGGISQQQYEAALMFLEVHNNYLRAIGAQGAIWSECLEKTFGETEEELTRRNKARFDGMMRAVREAQWESPNDNLIAALQYLVIEDLQLPHMIGSIRLALNALHRYFLFK